MSCMSLRSTLAPNVTIRQDPLLENGQYGLLLDMNSAIVHHQYFYFQLMTICMVELSEDNAMTGGGMPA